MINVINNSTADLKMPGEMCLAPGPVEASFPDELDGNVARAVAKGPLPICQFYARKEYNKLTILREENCIWKRVTLQK